MTNLMQSSISSLPSADWQTLGPWQFAVRFDTIMFFLSTRDIVSWLFLA